MKLAQQLGYHTLRHWLRRARSAEYRRSDEAALRDFETFCRDFGGRHLSIDLREPGVPRKRALLLSLNFAAGAKMEAWKIKVLQAGGFDTFVLGTRTPAALRYHRLAGAAGAASWEDYPADGDVAWLDQQLPGLEHIRDWLGLVYRGVHVGRFAVASAMRELRRGSLDLRDPAIATLLRQRTAGSIRFVQSGIALLDDLRPDALLFSDRGYTGQGELFDLGLLRGIDTLTSSGSYRSNLLLFKRYTAANEREHPGSMSKRSWEEMCSIPWQSAYGDAARAELLDSYTTQDWFSSYGVQFGKVVVDPGGTRQRLGIPEGKKVAAIFPHILWDGSFFWGQDIFDDYTQWFAATLRAAVANPKLHWVVKLHPGHVVKSKRESLGNRFQEIEVIEQAVGPLPPHVTLIYPDNEVSTYSLLRSVDYVVTVRGTVGIEAALFGVPVVTAGTGRYDRRGFTLDSTTVEGYLGRLASLETEGPLTPEQVELAERYAYGVFFCRPTRLRSVSMEYERDAVATSRVTVRCASRDEWLASPDIRNTSRWLGDRRAEEMMEWPEELGR